MEILVVKEEVKRGDILMCDDQGDLVKYRATPQPIGVANRNIKKGETVKYSPRENTEDIVIEWNSGK